MLQTLITKKEAVLNDRPLTYITSDIRDADPLTPLHLLCGHRIISLTYLLVEVDEIKDPTYGSARDVHSRVRKQSLVLQRLISMPMER